MIKKIKEFIHIKATLEKFFIKVKLNPNAVLLMGIICSCRIEEIKNSVTKQARYLDELMDELVKERKMEEILRKS